MRKRSKRWTRARTTPFQVLPWSLADGLRNIRVETYWILPSFGALLVLIIIHSTIGDDQFPIDCNHYKKQIKCQLFGKLRVGFELKPVLDETHNGPLKLHWRRLLEKNWNIWGWGSQTRAGASLGSKLFIPPFSHTSLLFLCSPNWC